MNDQLNVAVHKALGKTVCEHEWEREKGFKVKYQCRVCHRVQHSDYKRGLHKTSAVPAYSTDPRHWAPLLEELLKAGRDVFYDNDKKLFVVCREFDPALPGMIQAVNARIGTALCEAFVKYKEQSK